MKHITPADYKTGILEVGDTMTDDHTRSNLSEAKGGYTYKVIYISENGYYAVTRILPSGKQSKRITSGLWAHESDRYIPGGENPWT